MIGATQPGPYEYLQRLLAWHKVPNVTATPTQSGSIEFCFPYRLHPTLIRSESGACYGRDSVTPPQSVCNHGSAKLGLGITYRAAGLSDHSLNCPGQRLSHLAHLDIVHVLIDKHQDNHDEGC